MKKLIVKKTIVVASFLLIAGFIASQAFAFMGGGYNGMMGGNYNNMMGYSGGHMWESLSVEDQNAMQEQMNQFFDATKEIREQAYQKRLELNQEFAKPEKDMAKIEALQKELFEISSRFEKERFDHMTRMQNRFSNRAGGSFMGYGGGC